MARSFEFGSQRTEAVKPVRLMERPFVPVESQPLHAFKNRRRHLRPGTVGVGVFDPQDEDAVHAARKKPVVKRGPGSTDVQVAGG
jgi:hypothetical protein